MSTDWNGDGQIDQGYCKKPETGSSLDPTLEGNPFGNANVVRVWYCGSDNHQGRASVELEDLDGDVDGKPLNFSMHFKGRRIVEAALATLDAGVTSDDGVVTLPKLGELKMVVISGSSAGAKGALQNMDSIGDHVLAQAPDAVIRGVLDANLPASDTVYETAGVYIDAAFDEMATPGVNFAAWGQQNITDSLTDGWLLAANAFHDQSCVDAVMAQDGVSGLHDCVTIPSLLLRETDGLTTPTFVRMDLGDKVIGGMYKPCVNPLTEASCYATQHSFLSMQNENPSSWLTLDDATDHFRATAIQVFNAGGAVTGIFSPNCGTHTGFTNPNFSVQVASDYSNGQFGPPKTFMQTVSTWLETGVPVRVIDASDASADAPSSQCQGGSDG